MDLIRSLLIFAFIGCQHIQQAYGVTYVCNGLVMEEDGNRRPPTCIIMGNVPKPWEAARIYCRSFGGTLFSRVLESADIFNINGVDNVWSGIFKEGIRALQETQTTPKSAESKMYAWRWTQPSTAPSQDVCAAFVSKSKPCSGLDKRKIAATQGDLDPRDQGTRCYGEFYLEWQNCATERNFICEIPAKPLQSLHMEGNKKFSIDGHPGFEMFFSSAKMPHSFSSHLCDQGGKGGRVFSVATPADRAILKFVAQNVGSYLAQLRITDVEYETSFFWVNDKNTPGCDALYLKSEDNIISWPCDAQLRALCWSDVPVKETKPPVLSVTIEGGGDEYWKRDNSVVLVHSHVLVSSFRQTHDMTRLQIQCQVDVTSTRQNITFYRNGEPIAYSNWNQQRTQSSSEWNLHEANILTRTLTGYYHCEVNDLKTYRVLKSNKVFIQPRDLETYAVNLRFKQPDDLTDLRRLQYQLLFNEGNQQDPGRTLIQRLEKKAQTYGGYRITALSLQTQPPTLVAYLFGRLPQIPEFPITDFAPNRTMLDKIQSVADTVIGWEEGGLTIDHVIVRSIDYCLATKGRDPISGLEYSLPDTKAGKKVSIPWMCDGTKTTRYAECSGDKLMGYDWSLLQSPCHGTTTTNPTTEGSTRQTTTADNRDNEAQRATENISRAVVKNCSATSLSVELTNATYVLPERPEGTVWGSPETCARDNKPIITSQCKEGKDGQVVWAPYQVNPLCNYSRVDALASPKTRELSALSVKTINKDNVAEVGKQLKTLIKANQASNFTKNDVALIADTLTKVGQLEKEEVPPVTVQTLLDSVSDVSQLPGDVLQDAQNHSDATNRILRTADKLGSLLKLDSNETSKRLISEGIGLEVWDIDKQSPNDSSVIGIKVISKGEEKKIQDGQLETQFTNGSRSYNNTQTAIYLPQEILKQYSSGNSTSKVRLVMNIYKDTNLYSASGTVIGAKFNRTLNSRVIAAQLLVDGQQISDLGDKKVITVFEPIVSDVAVDGKTHKVSCAFWNFSSDLSGGQWSTEGCEHRNNEEGRDVCECNHLTNFAVLLDYYDQSTLAHKEALGYITKIGLSLSIIGLSLSMIAFLCIKKLRQGRPQQTMFQLSVSLVLSWLVFLLGIERTSSHGGCVVVALLLHYLILTSFMWMLMEAIVLYLLVVKVMNPHISHYMWKMGLPSWGLPIIPVIIVLATDPDLYIGGPHYCWMSKQVLYYGFALPVGLILLSNLAIFIRICISLFWRKDMSQHSSMKKNQTVVNIKASFTSFCMLGMTWLFGFLAIEGARLAFQYLFCITASLQGFLIFLMITTRDPQIRRYLMDNVCCCMKRWVSRDTSGATPSSSTSNSGSKGSRPLKSRFKEFFSGPAARKTSVTMLTTSTGLASEANGQEEETSMLADSKQDGTKIETQASSMAAGSKQDGTKIETQASSMSAGSKKDGTKIETQASSMAADSKKDGTKIETQT